jgi:hypothetical protein
MPSTYTLISSNVLSSSAASVTFSAIPSTYTDLVLRCSMRNSDTGGSAIQIRFNGDTATNYSQTVLAGYGSSVGSSRDSSISQIDFFAPDTSSNTANTFSSAEIYIPNYLISQNKPLSLCSFTEDNSVSTNIFNYNTAGLWRNTAAITSVSLSNSGALNFVSGSSFYLYGISKS